MYNFMKKGAMMLLIAGLAMSVTNCVVTMTRIMTT